MRSAIFKEKRQEEQQNKTTTTTNNNYIQNFISIFLFKKFDNKVKIASDKNET